ncbi:hypothetical protein PPYR_03529 [Photinus pyralis]|uniref:Uncharacterized protein n=1 Tax=Photinus pyralis TaxID=7054 RepID=A0A5N4A379_PHOPY|nr:uncharacterized protein LOC116162049 [Photinus pyralis]KAB0791729.1 hypothetical protein PPYR_03529 [Photinus pyralis]
MENDEEELYCDSVCIEMLTGEKQDCSHSFCKDLIEKWRGHKDDCAICVPEHQDDAVPGPSGLANNANVGDGSSPSASDDESSSSEEELRWTRHFSVYSEDIDDSGASHTATIGEGCSVYSDTIHKGRCESAASLDDYEEGHLKMYPCPLPPHLRQPVESDTDAGFASDSSSSGRPSPQAPLLLLVLDVHERRNRRNESREQYKRADDENFSIPERYERYAEKYKFRKYDSF